MLSGKHCLRYAHQPQLLIALLGLALGPAIAFAQERSADVHTHGTGRLQLIQAGTEVGLALDVAAADVLGFEHAPESEAERSAAASAAARLEDPLGLFDLNGLCTVTSVTVEGVAGDHDGHAASHHEHQGGADHDHEEAHSDVEASYEMICDQPITTLSTEFFAAFAGAQALRVQALLDGRAVIGDLTRTSPVLDLTR